MAADFDDIPVIHELCNGQGCRLCDQGELIVREYYTEEAK